KSRNLPQVINRDQKIDLLKNNAKNWLNDSNISIITKIYYLQGYIISLIKSSGNTELGVPSILYLRSNTSNKSLSEIQRILYDIISDNFDPGKYSKHIVSFIAGFFQVPSL